MKEFIYCLFSRLSNSYVGMFQQPTDLGASVYIHRTLSKSPDYEYIDICKVGEVDIKTGIISPLSVTRIDKYQMPENTPMDEIEKRLAE